MFDLYRSLRAIAFASVTWIVITNLDNWINAVLIQYFELDTKTLWGLFVLAMITLFIGLVVMWGADLNVGDILGEAHI